MWPPAATAEEEDDSLTAEDQACLEKLTQGYRLENKRVTMPVLWREDDPDFPPTRDYAVKRMLANECKLKSEPELWGKYNDILDGYVVKGYTQPVVDGFQHKDVCASPAY